MTERAGEESVGLGAAVVCLSADDVAITKLSLSVATARTGGLDAWVGCAALEASAAGEIILGWFGAAEAALLALARSLSVSQHLAPCSPEGASSSEQPMNSSWLNLPVRTL